jgi:hypothetical protein
MLEANRELGKLKARFPAFEFHLIAGRGRNRFEAVRKGGSDGLYAVISTDPAEVAEELTHAA